MNSIPDIRFPNLGIEFNNVPRYLIGDVRELSIIYLPRFPNIMLYAVMIVIGIAAAALLGFWYAKKIGQKVEDYVDLLTLGVILAVIGLRLYFVAFNWDYYSGNLMRIFNIRGGGLAIYGGIIGAILAGVITSARKNIPFTVMADVGAPSMLLGQAIGRWGNFFNREAFGGDTDSLFAMQIRLDQSLYTTRELLDTAVVSVNDMLYFQVHPTFLYEATFNFILMIALLLYRPHKKFNGEIILLYLLGYGIIRFFVEGLRTDQMMLGSLPLNQVTSVIFATAAAILLIAGHVHSRKASSRRAKRGSATK